MRAELFQRRSPNPTPRTTAVISAFRSRLAVLITLTGVIVLGAGCAQLRLPAIDPSGQSIFLPQSTPLVGPFSSPDAVFPSAQALPQAGTCNPPQPYGWSPITTAPTAETGGLFTGLGSRIWNPLTSATGGPPAAPPQPLVPVPEYGGGLAQPPVPAPIGNRNFLVGSGSPRPGYDGTFTITPARMVAPVGSTVILRAGICDEDGYLVMRQPIEWSLSPNSVGSIVDVDKTAKRLWRHLFHKPPEKQSGDYAVGLTSTVPQMLDRGTLDPNDDIWLMRGQTWMSVTSASEGATHVTSVAPSVNGWNERKGKCHDLLGRRSVAHADSGGQWLRRAHAGYKRGPLHDRSTDSRLDRSLPGAGRNSRIARCKRGSDSGSAHGQPRQRIGRGDS